jgi:two-component system phosphate regulon response regulator PhoB
MGLPIFSPMPVSARPPVLIVDDNPAESAVTLATLETGGFAAIAESEGDAALRHARRSLTHLLISELYIPCAEGTCVVTVLKSERTRLPRLQVLVHTRHTSELDTEWALEAGCDALVPKGASADVLVREVRRLEGFAA